MKFDENSNAGCLARLDCIERDSIGRRAKSVLLASLVPSGPDGFVSPPTLE